MSNNYENSHPHDAGQAPLNVLPVYAPPPPRRSPLRWIVRGFVFLVLVFSLGLNFLFFLALGFGDDFGGEGSHVHERYHSGNRSASDKIAVVTIDGILMEGMHPFAQKEIEKAAHDKSVKAVVLRINSPGGSITASDDLHHRITELRDGNKDKKTAAKPIIVSMGGVAASGGYYIAMPAQTLLAERTTITGSIGVYAALPNVTELSQKIGFKMDVLRAGEVKDSGSPFHDMTPHERELWQTMVDHSYLQFLQVVEQGRPQLKGKLQEDIVVDEILPVRSQDTQQKKVKFTRYRADGGIFTAEEAEKYGLIDRIGYLEDALQLAKQAASLGDHYKAVIYERPLSLLGALTGAKSQPPPQVFDASQLSSAAVPRLWYLSPQSELAGILSAVRP